MKPVLLLAAAAVLGGCATKPVPESRLRQVEQINQVGPYSYQRAIDGPPR